MTDGWKNVISKVLSAFVIVGITVVVAAFVSPFVNAALQLSPEQVRWFRLGALAMVAWGVLGKSGWEIESWKPQNPHERFDSWWFTAIYILGLFCGALGILLNCAYKENAHNVLCKVVDPGNTGRIRCHDFTYII